MIFPGTSAERREGKKEAFMAENKKFVITVGRQYGSGGAEMAKRLGERLGLHVYDKEILKMTSEESGIRESYFHLPMKKPEISCYTGSSTLCSGKRNPVSGS